METDYPSFEVVVVDCITAGIETWMESRFPNVRLLNFDTDIGVSAQRNAGLRLTDPDSEVVVFVDNDVVVEPTWLADLVEALYLDPSIGAAQPLLLGLDEGVGIDSVGGYIDRLGFVVLPAHIPSWVRESVGSGVVPIFFCEAITAVKRSVLVELVEAFDPDFVQHYEDVDLGWRVHLLGYNVVLARGSVVRHARGVSGGLLAQPPYTVYLNTRNRLTTLLKCYAGWNLIRYVPATLVLEALKSVLLLFFRGDHSVALIMGFLDTLLDFRAVWRKRLNVQARLRRVDDEDIETILGPSLMRLVRDFGRHYGHGSR
jgi:GT2 family glycosyltransferase